MKKVSTLVIGISGMAVLSSQAAVINMQLIGKAGSGLLPGNENHAITVAGTGGLAGTGIFFDDVSKKLTISVAWGSGNGFTNLTGNATAGHIHGPTASGGSASFTQTSGVRIGLDSGPTWNNNAISGGISGRELILDAAQESELLAGRWYINIHTTINPGGEIRGNIVPIPETSAATLGLLGATALLARRRRQHG